MLAEQSYFHGVAALTNSLVQQGFRGRVMVGYRGHLPNWATELLADGAPFATVAPDVTMHFVVIDPAPPGIIARSPWGLSNMKAHFLQQVATTHCPNLDVLYYFDVDIVIVCHWDHFRRWAEHGLVAVQDMAEPAMSAHHAYRHEWRAFAARAGFGCREISGYYNSGCLGVSRENVPLLDVWARLQEQFAAEGGNMTRITAIGERPEYARMDQDLMNIALMVSPAPLAVLGREAMGCFPMTSIMLHAMVFQKPWIRRYVRDALKGFPPDLAHLGFWRHTNGPLHSFTARERRQKRAQLRLAKWIGLLRRRAIADW
jgi:hypothetical protein